MKNLTFFFLPLLFMSTTCVKPQQEVKNLATFAKAYGYVKYFHPSNEAADLDWNTFSAYGANEILKCKSQADVIKTLNDLFQPLGPGIVFSGKNEKYDLTAITPSNPDEYLPTYWQHTGVSFGMSRSDTPYSSVRANQSSSIDESDAFGTLTLGMKAEKYRGKELKYTGWVKLKEETQGTGHLWMRVDKEDGSRGYFDNMIARPIKSNEWEQYEIIGSADDLASNILIGSFIMGKGTLYLDEITLSYKEGDEWIPIPLNNNDFESELNKGEIKDSNWFGKSKGYTYTLSDTEQKAGKTCAVITFEGSTRKINGEPTFEKFPKFGELIENKIGDDIFCQIPLNLYGNKEHTYPMSPSIKQLTTKIKESEITNNDQAVMLGNVINTYNLFQHFYPYFDVVDVDWKEELKAALSRSLNDKSIDDHIITLQKLTAPLKDGHISIRGGTPQWHAPPIEWELIEDQLIITKVYNDSLNLKIGDRVSKVDQQPVEEYITEIKSRISGGTDGYINHRFKSVSLLGEEGSEITIKANNEIHTLERNRKFDFRESGIKIQEHQHKLLEDNIVYLNLSKIKMDSINSLMPQLEQSSGIICDLRGYPKSNHELIAHLLPQNDTTMAWMKVPKIIYPDQENNIGYEGHEWLMKTKEPHLGNKKVIFIIDGRAISYAESYLGYIEGYDLATLVGQPTAGTNGNINPFKLLNDIYVVWTGMKVVKHDGSQHHARGIIPNVYVTRTIEGVKSGKDEFLEKAIEVMKNLKD